MAQPPTEDDALEHHHRRSSLCHLHSHTQRLTQGDAMKLPRFSPDGLLIGGLFTLVTGWLTGDEKGFLVGGCLVALIGAIWWALDRHSHKISKL